MENQKDTQSNSVKDSSTVKGDFYRYVSLKSEKMTSALYMITDFLSDSEPIKWKLRERSLNLITEASTLLKDRKDFFGVTGLGRMLAVINDIVTILDVAYVGGAVSQMNFEILRQEYLSLAKLIEEKMYQEPLKKYISDDRIGLSYRNVLLETIAGKSEPETLPQQASSNIPRDLQAVKFTPTKKPEKEKNVPHRPSNSIGQKDTEKDTANDLYGLNSREDKKSLRREQIINFLKDKGWTGINDISRILTDCGPKTVQRELLEMVTRGILLKQGERRWSRYMLAK